MVFGVLLFLGEADALGLQGLELIVNPDVGGHQEDLCVKMVKGCSRSGCITPPLFFTPRGFRSSSTRRH